MNTSLAIFLVDWLMGTVVIGVFVAVCIVLVIVIMNLVKSDKKNNQTDLDNG